MKRYRYRAYPTGEQARAATRTFGCARVVFNDYLAERRRLREEGRHREVPFSGTVKAVTTLAKRTPERAWLSEVSNTPLQQSVRDAERAYRNWFDSLSGQRKGRKTGFPRFKSRRDQRQTARFTRNSGFSVRETTHGVGFARLPKIGHVRFTLSRPLPSEPSSVTLIRSASGTWHVSFVVDVPDLAPLPDTGRVVGVDLGLTDLAAIARSDDTREKVSAPRHLRAKERKLARAQRELARRKKGSANREKSRAKVARIHEKVAAARLDHHHKLASRLVRENQAIGLETLSITGLVRTRLARSIHDAGWGILVRLIEEKASAHPNRTVVREGWWAPTTRTCGVCAVVSDPKPLSVRTWTCQHCGTVLDRDYNAATNLLVAAGHAETENACGGDVRRQPDRALRLRLAGAVPDEAGTHRTDLVTRSGRVGIPRPPDGGGCQQTEINRAQLEKPVELGADGFPVPGVPYSPNALGRAGKKLTGERIRIEEAAELPYAKGTWTVTGRTTSNHRVTWETSDPAAVGEVAELTGKISDVEDIGVKTAVIDVP